MGGRGCLSVTAGWLAGSALKCLVVGPLTCGWTYPGQGSVSATNLPHQISKRCESIQLSVSGLVILSTSHRLSAPRMTSNTKTSTSFLQPWPGSVVDYHVAREYPYPRGNGHIWPKSRKFGFDFATVRYHVLTPISYTVRLE